MTTDSDQPDEAILAFVRELAKKAAREDYEAEVQLARTAQLRADQ
jgi:hypothetical protein